MWTQHLCFGNSKRFSSGKQRRTSSNVVINDVTRALEVLQLSRRDQPFPPSKSLIQRQFSLAAKKYHPDAKHVSTATPCPRRFREACEARLFLIDYYHEGPMAAQRFQDDLRQRHYQEWRRQHPHHAATNTKNPRTRRFAQGFPHQTLKVLTLRQNLAIRGTVVMCLLLAMGYDLYMRRELQVDRKPRTIEQVKRHATASR